MQNECGVLFFRIDDKQPNAKLETMLVLSPFQMKPSNNYREKFHSETNQRLKTNNMLLFEKAWKLSNWLGSNVIYAKVMEGNQTNKTCKFDNQMSRTNQEDERTFNKEKP